MKELGISMSEMSSLEYMPQIEIKADPNILAKKVKLHNRKKKIPKFWQNDEEFRGFHEGTL